MSQRAERARARRPNHASVALVGSLAVVGGVASCAASIESGAGLATDPEPLDYNAFVCTAMPALIRRCSYLGCHGSRDHAFRLYSPGKLRRNAPEDRRARDQPLTADEISDNYASTVGLLRGATPEQRRAVDLRVLPLLSKPLAEAFFGGEHAGVAIFPVPPAARPSEDPEWNALVAWVAGAAQRPPDAACTELFRSLALEPRP